MNQPSVPASRALVRAVLETRDHRHNETHAMLLALFQGLVAELAEQGALKPGPLADRLAQSDAAIRADAHGDPARSMLAHVVDWLRATAPAPAVPSAPRWQAPNAAAD